MEWYDDPLFDDAEETYRGKLFRGEAWRALQWSKARGVREVVSVAGTTFRSHAVEALRDKPKAATLVAEPDNPHDPKAVRVEVGGTHVGYLPRGMALAPDATVHVVKCGAEPAPHVWLAVF